MKTKPTQNEDGDDEKDPASIVDKIKDCPLHTRTPFGIQGVSMGQFSIARHYGGIEFNGERYTYFPETDELVRNDVVKWMNKPKTNPTAPVDKGRGLG